MTYYIHITYIISSPWWLCGYRVLLQCESCVRIPGSGRSPGEGNANPIQYSCLENSVKRGTWWATVHGLARSQPRLSGTFTFILRWNSSFSALQYLAHLTIVVVKSFTHIWLWDPINCNPPGFPILHYFLEFAQTHVHWFSDAIQPSYLLLLPSPPALSLSHHRGLFQWVHSSQQVVKVLDLHHQSFQWIFKVDFL